VPQAKKVPHHLHALVMRLAGDGKTGESIAEILWREHRIECSTRSVQRLIEQYRTEQKHIAQAVVRTAIRQHLLPVVKRIGLVIARAREMERQARERASALRTEADGHPQHPQAVKEDLLALRPQDRQLRAAVILLHYAGLDAPDDVKPPAGTGPDARAALLKGIEEIIKATTATEGAPAADPQKKPDDEDPVH
jgi:Flp pilus assembly protein TadD